MRRAAVVAVVTCVAAIGVAACGGGGGGSGSSKSGGSVNPNSAQSAKGNVTWCIGKDTTGAFKQVVALHNQANPNVKASLVELPEDATQQLNQLTQRLRAKSSQCDVLGMDVVWTAQFASQGWLKDLSNVVDKRRSEFIPSTLETAHYQGKYWALPFNTNAGFLYYRTDQVPKAPSDWTQVYTEAKSKNGIVYQGSQYEGLTVDYLELLYSAGGKVLSGDGKSAAIDSPQATQALSLMVNGIKSGAAPKAVLTYKEEEARRAFESGKYTFMRNWPYAYALDKKTSIGNKFAVAPLPGFNGKPASGVIGGYNLGISAYSKNPSAALEFANYITGAKPQAIFAAKAALPPVLTQTYSDPSVKSALPFASELLTAVQQAKARPVSPVYQQISEAIYKNVYSALQGSTSPAAAVKAMQSQINSALKTF
jgi:multiple sugar transport system substrate-binding protein